MPRSMQEVLEDFEWTRPYHRGDTLLAAERLGMSHAALTKHLCRAKRMGMQVSEFHNVQHGHVYG